MSRELCYTVVSTTVHLRVKNSKKKKSLTIIVTDNSFDLVDLLKAPGGPPRDGWATLLENAGM